MMKNPHFLILFFIYFLFFIFSCKENNNVQTQNQKKIIDNYRKFNVLIKADNDSIEYYSNVIEKLALKESDPYIAISKRAKALVNLTQLAVTRLQIPYNSANYFF